jgi:hypothetical protein
MSPVGSTTPMLTLGKPSLIEKITPQVVSASAWNDQMPDPNSSIWMLELAAEVLLASGRRTNQHLLSDLRVHRSSAVGAILAQLSEARLSRSARSSFG